MAWGLRWGRGSGERCKDTKATDLLWLCCKLVTVRELIALQAALAVAAHWHQESGRRA